MQALHGTQKHCPKLPHLRGLVEAVGDGGGGGLVDDAQHLQARNRARILRCITTRACEVSRYAGGVVPQGPQLRPHPAFQGGHRAEVRGSGRSTSQPAMAPAPVADLTQPKGRMAIETTRLGGLPLRVQQLSRRQAPAAVHTALKPWQLSRTLVA